MTKELVVDTSVAVSWALDDERNPDCERILTAVRTESVQLTVPDLWLYEGLNAIRSATLRRRLPVWSASASAKFLCELPKTVVPVTESRASEILDVSLREGLTVYDAAYLALARERNADLITWDKELLALPDPGVRIISPEQLQP